MSKENEPLVTVKILDRNYRIKCTPEEAPALRSAASYVDSKMRKLKQTGRVNSTDSMAVVVALNIAHELIDSKKSNADKQAQLDEHILKITKHIDLALAKEPSTEVQ